MIIPMRNLASYSNGLAPHFSKKLNFFCKDYTYDILSYQPTPQPTEKMSHYLMHPAIWQDASCVFGFNSLNGNTYIEYITLNIPLTEEQKAELNTLKTSDQLEGFWKKHNISVTHDYHD